MRYLVIRKERLAERQIALIALNDFVCAILACFSYVNICMLLAQFAKTFFLGKYDFQLF